MRVWGSIGILAVGWAGVVCMCARVHLDHPAHPPPHVRPPLRTYFMFGDAMAGSLMVVGTGWVVRLWYTHIRAVLSLSPVCPWFEKHTHSRWINHGISQRE